MGETIQTTEIGISVPVPRYAGETLLVRVGPVERSYVVVSVDDMLIWQEGKPPEREHG